LGLSWPIPISATLKFGESGIETDLAYLAGLVALALGGDSPLYHDRMPLALADDKVATWIDLVVDEPLRGNLLLDLAEFTVRPMDRAMNNARQKDLAAIDPAA
jgi:putative SOS response-associated peptidase YedK